jgi:hypothetical protein
MKSFIAAALLPVLISPAFAFGSSDQWDCGNGIEISRGKWLSVSITDPTEPSAEGYQPYPEKGKFTLKWSSKGFRLNGKTCVQLSDKMHWTKSCAAGDKESCEQLANGWGLTPIQVEHAVNSWKTTWPGNTVKHR